jgi:predicted ATPase/DNA-binding SARP family transcriptional activator
MPTLHIHLLGDFRLTYGDALVGNVSAPRLQALLAYLLLHRHAPQPRQHLAFRLWPDTTESQARTNLRQLLHSLKHTLPQADQFVHTDAQTLGWRSDAPFRLDVAEFEQALSQADAAQQQGTAEQQGDPHALRVALEQAIALYGGELLPNCYDDWIVPERERLRQAFTGALQRLLLLLDRESEPRAAIAYAERLLRHDPLSEETYRALMRLYAECGDRAAVVRVYQTCATVLERELAVEPSAATREAYEQSLKVDAQARPVTPPQPSNTNLPVPLTSFVGREAEITEVAHLLQTTRLLTLSGPGGTGKTRLALEAATKLLNDYPNGVWLVELAPLADPTLVAQTMAATLGVREQPGRTILDALMDYLRAKTMLLILDNCEHLIDSCAQLAESLLRAAPRLKLLASSREALGIAGETAYRVPSLSLPVSQQLSNLDALSQNDCVHLFVDRALAAYPPFRFKEKNAPAIADICRRLDGIPLALELAAARVAVFSPEEIAARLDDRFRLLTGGSRTALERHQTLRALIDWSHDLLADAERGLFRQLSVFAGGWTFEAAEAVCSELNVLNLLTQLVNKSLVMVEEQAEGTRYRLPETIRQYARDKLFESGEAEQVRDRHLDFFLRFAEAAERKLRSAEQLACLERVEIEHDNVRTALAWSLESGKSESTLRLAGALYYFWLLRGYFSEGHKWLDDALALTERKQGEGLSAGETHADMARRAKVLYGAAWLQMGTMNLKSARKKAEGSLRLWRELGDMWWTAVALEQSALIMTMVDFQTACAYLEEGIALAREVEDPWPLAVCLIRMGDVLKPRGEAAAARPFLEEGVALARTIGDKAVLSEGLRELGSLYYTDGELTAASDLTEEALAEARAIGSGFQVFLAMLQLVAISCLQNDPAKAKRYCRELWALAKDMGALFAAGFGLLAFGLVACFGGEPQRGVRLIAALEALFLQYGIKPGEGDALMKVVRQGLEKARAQLGPTPFEAAQQAGRALTPEQAIALATENESEDSQLPNAGLGPSSN